MHNVTNLSLGLPLLIIVLELSQLNRTASKKQPISFEVGKLKIINNAYNTVSSGKTFHWGSWTGTFWYLLPGNTNLSHNQKLQGGLGIFVDMGTCTHIKVLKRHLLFLGRYVHYSVFLVVGDRSIWGF